MKNNADKLSVIIPVYNGEKYLSDAVSSLRSQNWSGEMEIIIVDDGSMDGSLLLAKAIGDIVLNQPRGGAAKARNAGLRASTGEWVMFLDADDVMRESALEQLYTPFTLKPELMAVFGRAEDFYSPELTDQQKTKIQIRKENYGGYLSGCGLFRRQVFTKIGAFDESLRSGETVEWQIRFRQSGLLSTQLDLVTTRRRLHLTNTGRLEAEQEMRNYAAILRKRMNLK